jgi:TolB-like protein
MKKLWSSLAVLLLTLNSMVHAQELPRLAVVEFTTNSQRARENAVTVRDLVESQMISTRKYEVITRNEIDKLLDNQQIAVSSISSTENVMKLQLLNISYIVTGSVNAIEYDYAVTVKMLDVSTGKFSNSADALMGSSSRDLYTGVNALVANFVNGMSAEGGQVVQSTTMIIEEYEVGDFGPAGGWIFYDKGRVSNGWRYLEAAPSDTSFTAQWGSYGRNTGATDTAIGTGKQNTEIIVSYLRGIGENGRAAQLCDNLVVKGYDDWFLPSKDELNLMYTNLKAKGMGRFNNDWYWSSSEANNLSAWFHDFSDGRQDDGSKNITNSVRAVRAF